MKLSKPDPKRTLKLLKLAEDLTEKQRRKNKIICSELLEYLKDIHDYSGFDEETLFQVSFNLLRHFVSFNNVINLRPLELLS